MIFRWGQAASRPATPRRGLEDLLEIVEDQQQAAVPEEYGEQFLERTAAHIAQAERLGDSGDDEGGVADRRQVDERDPVGKGRGDVLGDPEGEAGLADAAGTGQGQEANVVPQQEVADSGHLSLASDERRKREGQGADVLVRLSDSHEANAPE